MKNLLFFYITLFLSCNSYIINFKNDNNSLIFRKVWNKNNRKLPNNFKLYMKRLRNAYVEIDLENRKDLTKIEIIKMFLKGVKECKNVEYLKEKMKGHVPPTTKRKLMKQKRMVNLRIHIKNTRIKKQEEVAPHKNILNFPLNQLKNINAAVLYFRHYFEKYEKNTK
ncbi:conserved Plasmodium protein, unknown function [Plasmodium gallinaceum]|uniref:Uncharacterized protein n=1 Tax=Plasmodium gallinaceum TaxID=5849 RepID=A0A1J1GLQ4_PLAGA|nr:conserved Plasmodium protein, unknown function [Plasmodium gallinaceum]CRG93276.1 conserved Plasmodium protein, unknown function [Plasmodium gallinaceum]